MINIQNELKDWLVDYITNAVHNLKIDGNEEFNTWAQSFESDEAEFLVNIEFVNDWGYDKRNELPENEGIEYAKLLIQRILDNWYK